MDPVNGPNVTRDGPLLVARDGPLFADCLLLSFPWLCWSMWVSFFVLLVLFVLMYVSHEPSRLPCLTLNG